MVRSTKFNRSSLPQDLLVRQRLIDKLNKALGQPIALISAPAGYGKSVLATSFLQTCPLPSAWLALDEQDDDIHNFLKYLLAAVDAVFPGSMRQTQLFLETTDLPLVSVIADSLVADLVALDREFILALDDVHVLHDADIYELLAELIRHPVPGLHLMLISRRDPPLNLDRLRARGQMTEIRSVDLRFTAEEAAAFADRALNRSHTDEVIVALIEKSEGWAAGLRLAVLALQHGSDVARQLMPSTVENRYVMDYLFSEVLARVPPEIRDFLIRTSILNQICGPLCDALMEPTGLSARGQDHLEWLEKADFFTNSLDSQRVWYRYHHLFQLLLQREQARLYDAEETHSLHRRASLWYAGQGETEEAIRHALAGNDTATAVRLVAQQRHHLLNTEQRPRLAQLLGLFSDTDVDQHPDLLLAKAWIAELGRADTQVVLDLLDRAEALLPTLIEDPAHGSQIQGEIDALRSVEKGFAADDAQLVIKLTASALERVPRAWYLVHAEAWLQLAFAYQMTGQLARAYAVLAEGEKEEEANPDKPGIRILGSNAFIHLIAADLPSLLRTGKDVIRISERSNFRESLCWGHHFLAIVYYEKDDLAAAELHAEIVLKQPHACHRITVVQSAFILAAVHQARNRPDAANRALDRAREYLMETRSEALLPLVEAFAMELAVMKGDLSTAGSWAATVGPLIPLGIMAFFYVPQLTLPKVLLAIDTPSSRQQAATALATLKAFITKNHYTRFAIDVLALQALLCDAEGDEPAALRALEEALALARHSRFIRLFVDLGAAMHDLLQRLAEQNGNTEYVEQILMAFRADSASAVSPSTATLTPPKQDLIEPLTNRELDVLELLAERLSDKEIADRLFISDRTVKRHTANIYEKLDVHSRVAAVAAAKTYGLLPQ